MTKDDLDQPATQRDVQALRQALADLPSVRLQTWVDRMRLAWVTARCGCGLAVPVHMRRDGIVTCAELWQTEPFTAAQWETIVGRFVAILARLEQRRRLRTQLLGAALSYGAGLAFLIWWIWR